MSDANDRWTAVGDAIAARMSQLSLSKAEVIRASGVSDKTLAGYLAGQPIVRPDKRRGLCDALGWTPDSIDRILNGDPPIDARLAAAVETAAMDLLIAQQRARDAAAQHDHYATIAEPDILGLASLRDLAEDAQEELDAARARLDAAQAALTRQADPSPAEDEPTRDLSTVERIERLEAIVASLAEHIGLDLSGVLEGSYGHLTVIGEPKDVDVVAFRSRPTELPLAARSGRAGRRRGDDAARPRGADPDPEQDAP